VTAAAQLLVEHFGIAPTFPLSTHLITRSLEAAQPKRMYYVSVCVGGGGEGVLTVAAAPAASLCVPEGVAANLHVCAFITPHCAVLPGCVRSCMRVRARR
jgi:hypothetical protein